MVVQRVSIAVVGAILLWSAGMLMAPRAAIAQAANLTDPRPVPPINMEQLGGGTVELADFSGNVVVLNLFATWCAPCRHEMPSLDRLQAKVADQPITVIALSIDRVGADRIQAWMDDLGVQHLTTLHDRTMQAAQALGAPGLPATYIIDGRGMERARVFGVEEWDADGIVQMLTALVSETG